MTTGGCQSKPPVINAQLGPENAKLVADLRKEIEALKTQIDQNKVVFSRVAGNAFAIDLGIPHIEESRGKTVVVEENKLIKSAVGEPKAEDKTLAQARAISILENDLAAQKKLYGDALTKIDTTKKELADKDKEIADRDKKLIDQADKAESERVKTAGETQATINGYANEIKRIKDEAAAKERRMWINTLRFGGFGIIVIGIIALAVTSGGALVPGLILIGSGGLVILIGVSIDILTSQPWFPVAAGIVGLMVVAGLVLFVMHLVKVHKIADKSVAVLNDMKTESATLAEAGDANAKAVASALEKNVAYRFGVPGTSGAKLLENAYVKTGLDAK